MSIPDPATPTKLAALLTLGNGHKLRTAGRVISYDPHTGMIVLSDEKIAIYVDVSLCLGTDSSTWLQELPNIITVFGHLESLEAPLPAPTPPRYGQPAAMLGLSVVIRALLVIHTPELNIEAWRYCIDDTYEPWEQ